MPIASFFSRWVILQGVKSRGAIADPDVISSLEDLEEGSVIFITVSDKIGSLKELGKSFRKLCEKKHHKFVLSSIHNSLVKSVHDLADGGLSVAIAESCIINRKNKKS